MLALFLLRILGKKQIAEITMYPINIPIWGLNDESKLMSSGNQK